MNFAEKMVRDFSANARKKRAELFRQFFTLDENTRILDLGAENGTNIHNILEGTKVRRENVSIADIFPESVAAGERNYGYRGVLIKEDEPLPFPDRHFDIVYCSSVIEHVTVAKADLGSWKSGRKFREVSRKRQKEFAAEIVRLGRQYFVQTPAKTFPVESHTWLPLIGYLPRRLFLPCVSLSNKLWGRTVEADFNLLGKKDMRMLFPDARIVREIKFGLTKSIMAVKTES